MSNALMPPQHWSQLTLDEQVRYWDDVNAGRVSGFSVKPPKARTRRHRGEHSTKPKCENPSWSRPKHYKKLGGQLGHAYNRLIKKDPVTGEQRLRMHVSRHPYFLKERQRAGRKKAFYPARARLLDAIWPVLVSFCDAGKHSVGMCVSRLAKELSPKDSKGEVLPGQEVTVSRLSRLLQEQVRYGTLEFSTKKEWDRVSRAWFPKFVYITAIGFQLLGVDLDKLLKEQEQKLRQSEERRQLIAEGLLSEDEEISPAAARKRWAEQKKKEALKYRRKRGAERKLANRLAKLEYDSRLYAMGEHLLKTMPADEAYWCSGDHLHKLAIQRLYQLDLGLGMPPS